MLALAMVTSNVQALFHPTWLTSLWYVPWLITGALVVVWAIFRAFDKATTGVQSPQPAPSPVDTGTGTGTGMEDAA
ncbi:hypothetical protein [Streptomyces sp. NPDC002994]|uniref:hypothetical protein n=1 Tax=Streptomyces sp. NPDC002994 TaxID=3154441 RepID=UPI0033A5C61D